MFALCVPISANRPNNLECLFFYFFNNFATPITTPYAVDHTASEGLMKGLLLLRHGFVIANSWD